MNVSEPDRDASPIRPERAVKGVFGPGGKLAAAHPRYERRQGQEWMAAAVEETLRKGGKLLVEAGTGVGKTLAYLVPAALSGRRVVVSTGTKNLQDQIIEKDLPFVIEKLGIEVTSTAVKGRDNYLCLRRYREFDRDPLLPTLQESEAYETLRAWRTTTQTGDRGEAAGLPEDASFWRTINARGDTCTGSRCEDYESCFLTKVRRKAAESQIVVVNHHLFFADLALREDAFGKVLPDYDAVIFDEAHLLEEVATLFFGVSCSSSRVLELAQDAARLLAGGGAREAPSEGRPGGSKAGRGARGPDAARRVSSGGRSRSRRGGAAAAPSEADDLQVAAQGFFEPLTRHPGRRRLDDSLRGPEFEARYESLKHALERVGEAAQAIGPPSDDLTALERRCREIGGQLEFIARAVDEAYVYWTEARGRSVVLSASPVDVSDLLEDTLFSTVHAAVLTSATLSVDGDFSFVRGRLGMGATEERVVPSPFDYGSQAVLYLPSAMPEPRQREYAARMLREIEALLAISSGRAFLLFTSYAELRRVEESLRGRIRFPLLVQGDMPRARLLEEFKRTRGAVLLGAASFWHGVDVVGEALSLVVIDKIPFDVPNDPLVAARIERIRALGGDAFHEYQIPSAAIELKQGLGRLIRNRSDRGILAILDARLKTRPYGASLLKAIPPFPVVTDLEQVRSFFASP